MGGSRAESRGRGQQLWPLPPAAESVAVTVPRAPLPVPHGPGWAHLGRPGEQVPKSDSEVLLRRCEHGGRSARGRAQTGTGQEQGQGQGKGMGRGKSRDSTGMGQQRAKGSEQGQGQGQEQAMAVVRTESGRGMERAGQGQHQGTGRSREMDGAGMAALQQLKQGLGALSWFLSRGWVPGETSGATRISWPTQGPANGHVPAMPGTRNPQPPAAILHLLLPSKPGGDSGAGTHWGSQYYSGPCHGGEEQPQKCQREGGGGAWDRPLGPSCHHAGHRNACIGINGL